MPRTLLAAAVGATAFAATLAISHALFTTPAVAQQRATQPIAVVYSIGILQDLYVDRGHNETLTQSEIQFREERILPLQEQIQSLEQSFLEAQGAGQDTSVIAAQYQQVQQTLNAAAQEMQQQLVTQNDDYMLQVYEEFKAVVREVCDELGYAYAITTANPDAEFNRTPGSVANQITARTIISSPESVNITAVVRDRLNLTDSTEQPSQGSQEESAESETDSER